MQRRYGVLGLLPIIMILAGCVGGGNVSVGDELPKTGTVNVPIKIVNPNSTHFMGYARVNLVYMSGLDDHDETLYTGLIGGVSSETGLEHAWQAELHPGRYEVYYRLEDPMTNPITNYESFGSFTIEAGQEGTLYEITVEIP